ncbi:hypothetical protein E2976_07360 [Paracoccus yeei]|uniref:hypothetical protein n=1 Tax=Paracoccus yeei TaxID=147645 RepID=UPI003BF7FE5D
MPKRLLYQPRRVNPAARRVLQQRHANALIRGGKAGDVRAWLIFPAGDFSSGTATDNPTPDALREMSAKSATGAVVAIPQGQIIERVDAVFAELAGA